MGKGLLGVSLNSFRVVVTLRLDMPARVTVP